MNAEFFRNCLAVWVLALFTLAAQAQDMPVQELERRLQQRDNTIIELLDRVEALEKRVGVRRQAKQPDEYLEQDIAPPSKADIAQSPGAVVVEEGAAERALERSLTRAGVLLLPTGVLEIEPGIIYSRREDTSPGFVTSDNQILPSETELNAMSLTADLALRLGLPWDSQLEVGLPYRWREVESVTNIGFVPTDSTKRSDNGFGDLRVGFAKTLLREGLWRPDIVGRFTWDTDSGETGGFEEFRTSLSALKRQDPLTFVGGLSYEYTSRDGEIKPGAATSVNFGSYIALSSETSLNFIFSATHQNETEQSGREIDGSGRDFGTLVIGGSTLLAPGTLFHFSVGVGLTDDAEDFTVSMSLPIRLDGRLF
jgi:hypothetical protein